MFIMSTFVAVCAAVASASAAPSKPHILMVIVDVSCSFYTSDAYTWRACRVCVCACVRVKKQVKQRWFSILALCQSALSVMRDEGRGGILLGPRCAALAVYHILIRASSSLSSSLSLFLSLSLSFSLSLTLSVCFKGLWLGRCRVAQGNTYTGSGHADHGQPGEGRD